jgi:hypothetical protein
MPVPLSDGEELHRPPGVPTYSFYDGAWHRDPAPPPLVVTRLEAIELRSGDVILATVPEETTPQEAERIARMLEAKFGPPVVVKTAQLGVEVYRPSKFDGSADT